MSIPIRAKSAFVAAVVAATLTHDVPQAHASIWDGDAAVITQLIAIIEQARQTKNAIEREIEFVEQSVNYTERLMGRLSGADFMDALYTLQEGERRYNRLTLAKTRVQWEIDAVDGSFERLFGTKLSTLTDQQLRRLKADLKDERKEAAKTATIAQSDAVDQATDTTVPEKLLEQTQRVEGMVGQQQITNQALLELSRQISALTVLISTTNRLMTTVEAAKVAEQEAADERNRRRLELPRLSPPQGVRIP